MNPTLPRPLWQVRPRNPEAEAALADSAKIHPVTAAILISRGYDTAEKVADFLDCDLSRLHDPSLLPDYDAGAKVIREAIASKDLIFIHGDYDVDGVTSAAILGRFLKSVEANVHVHVPHRVKEGYGIHHSMVDQAAAMGTKVFLTCDCGVSAVDTIARAKRHDMKVVITDHHEPPDNLPKAEALINPHLPTSKYPYIELSGAGVAFKFCAGLARDMGFKTENFYRGFLDLACLGTVADMMPITGENRVITRHGLDRIRESKKEGIQALLTVSQVVNKKLSTRDIGFKLGPRLNAAGRLEDAALSLELLLTTDKARAQELANEVDQINLRRREEQSLAVAEAIEWIKANEHHDRNALVVFNENWHPGLVGLIAGKLVEHFYRPAFALFQTADGYIKGSARSIPGFSIYDSIMDHMHMLMGGGGHQAAGGITMPAANLEAFRQSLHEYAGARLTPDDFIPKVRVDCEIEPGEIDLDVAYEIAKLEPFGQANPTPVFVARGLELTALKKVGQEGVHTQFTFRDRAGRIHKGVTFYAEDRFDYLALGDRLDVVFEVSIDSYQGSETVKWFVSDVEVC